MSARERIFAAIRAIAKDTDGPEAIAAQAESCAQAMKAALPAPEEADPVALFTLRASAEKVGAAVERVPTLSDLPQAVARYARAAGLAAARALQPHPLLQQLDWTGFDDAPLQPDTLIAVGLARAGVAETGSLVFHSAPEAPTLYGFEPLHHIVALDAKTILPRLEDYAAAERGKPQPRNVNFITGASGTTDIEGVLARGAHGPRQLHIVIFG